MKLIILFLSLFSLNSSYGGNIGIIHLDKVIFKLNEYKQIDEQVNKLIFDRQKKLVDFDAQIADKQKQIRVGILSEEKIEQVAKEIKMIQHKKQLYIEEAQSFVNQQEAILRKPLVKKTLTYLKEYAEKNNFDLIIEQDSIILENRKQLIDISDSVLKELNSK